MCGIAGFLVRPGSKLDPKTLERLADALLAGIDSRGGDACGMAALGEGMERAWIEKASCEARTFTEERRWMPSGISTVLLHTRFATQGHEAFASNNHPVSAGPVHVIHNGHISNDWELIREASHERAGRVDSEAIPAIVNHYGMERAGEAMEALEGPAAVAILHEGTGELILARGYANPLVVVDSDSLVIWASTREAIKEAWSAVLGTPPSKRRFWDVPEGQLIRYDRAGNRSLERFKVTDPYAGRVSQYRYTCPTPVKASPVAKGDTLDALRESMMGAADLARYEAERASTWDRPEHMEACEACGDYYSSHELFEVWDGWKVCPGCETRLDEAPLSSVRWPAREAGKGWTPGI